MPLFIPAMGPLYPIFTYPGAAAPPAFLFLFLFFSFSAMGPLHPFQYLPKGAHAPVPAMGPLHPIFPCHGARAAAPLSIPAKGGPCFCTCHGPLHPIFFFMPWGHCPCMGPLHPDYTCQGVTAARLYLPLDHCTPRTYPGDHCTPL